MRCTYGMSAEQIAERAGVDVSTARRWKSGKSRIPAAAQLVLEADLGAFSRAARGWKIDGETLVSPEGWRITLGEVLSLPLLQRQVAAAERELRVMKGIDAQPEPGEVPELDLERVRA